LKTLEAFSSSHENNIELDYTAQVPEDCSAAEDGNNMMDIPVISQHSESHGITCRSRGTVNCCVDDQQNQIITLSEYDCPQQTETETNTKHMESAMVTEGVVNSAYELHTGSAESDQPVTVIGRSGLTNDEVQTVVGLAGDLHGGKQAVHQLVTLANMDMEKTLFHVSGVNSENSKIHQVVTVVNGLDPITEANQRTVTLLSNVMEQKLHKHSTVTHVSLTGRSEPSQEDFVILPSASAKAAGIQNDNFSSSHIMFNDQSALLDLVPQQSELTQQKLEKSVKQVTVYHLQ
jgi:hypothetical protein